MYPTNHVKDIQNSSLPMDFVPTKHQQYLSHLHHVGRPKCGGKQFILKGLIKRKNKKNLPINYIWYRSETGGI